MKKLSFTKNEFFKSMSRAKASQVKLRLERYFSVDDFEVIKEPEKILVMLPMRDPISDGTFYIGEMLACKSIVSLEGVQGYGITGGDDFNKTLWIAMIDSALNRANGVSEKLKKDIQILIQEQTEMRERYNGKIACSVVNFQSMEGM